MILYRGKGCWVGILPFALLLAVGFAWQGYANIFHINGHIPRWLTCLPFIIAGPILYFWGRRLNEPLERAETEAVAKSLQADEDEYWDEDRNRDMDALRGRHSVYGVPMEWWGIACFGIGILFLCARLRH